MQKVNKYVIINHQKRQELNFMANDYIFQPSEILFRHKISENLPPNTYSMHIHNAYELLYFLDGDATHVIEDRKYKLKKGDLILIRPGRYHFIQIDSTSRYERVNILFDGEKHHVEGLELIPEPVEIVNLEDNPLAKDIFGKCDVYSQICTEEMFTRVLSHLLSELFYNLYSFPHTFSKESDRISPLISSALQYINDHLATITGIEEIANHLFVSESYLFRLFKKDLHSTPKKYILEKRLLMAQKMLSAGEKPARVAERCGFSDYTTFYRNYTSFFGHSPKASHSSGFPLK